MHFMALVLEKTDASFRGGVSSITEAIPLERAIARAQDLMHGKVPGCIVVTIG